MKNWEREKIHFAGKQLVEVVRHNNISRNNMIQKGMVDLDVTIMVWLRSISLSIWVLSIVEMKSESLLKCATDGVLAQ